MAQRARQITPRQRPVRISDVQIAYSTVIGKLPASIADGFGYTIVPYNGLPAERGQLAKTVPRGFATVHIRALLDQ